MIAEDSHLIHQCRVKQNAKFAKIFTKNNDICHLYRYNQTVSYLALPVQLSHKLRVSSRDACQAALLRHQLITSSAQTHTNTTTNIHTHTNTQSQPHSDCALSFGVTFRSLLLLVWLSAFASADKCRANNSYIQGHIVYIYIVRIGHINSTKLGNPRLPELACWRRHRRRHHLSVGIMFIYSLRSFFSPLLFTLVFGFVFCSAVCVDSHFVRLFNLSVNSFTFAGYPLKASVAHSSRYSALTQASLDSQLTFCQWDTLPQGGGGKERGESLHICA